MAQPSVQAHQETFPWKHIIGYVLSLVLSFAAFWLALAMHMSAAATIATIVVLAIFQMVVQLFMFMHLTERIYANTFHSMMIYIGIMFAACVVAGTIWVMTFKSAVS